MKFKGEDHDNLSLIFQCEGFPDCIMNNSMEQTLGKFCYKLSDAGCEIKTTKPYSPSQYQFAAEHEIMEFKKDAWRKLHLTVMTHRVWADCLECKAYMHSPRAYNIFKFKRKAPKIIMSGKTTGISQFYGLGW